MWPSKKLGGRLEALDLSSRRATPSRSSTSARRSLKRYGAKLFVVVPHVAEERDSHRTVLFYFLGGLVEHL